MFLKNRFVLMGKLCYTVKMLGGLYGADFSQCVSLGCWL